MSSIPTYSLPNLTEALPSETREPILRLRTVAPLPPTRRVTFTPDTIDNEHLGRLKSNCCCIYVAARVWNNRSTWSHNEHETEHCRGHTISIVKPPSNEPTTK